MKLSELDTSRAADVLCEAGAYALNIMTDEELATELKSKIDEILIERWENRLLPFSKFE